MEKYKNDIISVTENGVRILVKGMSLSGIEVNLGSVYFAKDMIVYKVKTEEKGFPFREIMDYIENKVASVIKEKYNIRIF